jgi:hypothetical protein
MQARCLTGNHRYLLCNRISSSKMGRGVHRARACDAALSSSPRRSIRGGFAPLGGPAYGQPPASVRRSRGSVLVDGADNFEATAPKASVRQIDRAHVIDRIVAGGRTYPPQREYREDGSYEDSPVMEQYEARPAGPYLSPLTVPQSLTEAVRCERLAELRHAPHFDRLSSGARSIERIGKDRHDREQRLPGIL